ncbi:MAG TPA: hypothetical protein IGS40_00925 [Trichormus sp. M33_DOE_039]|nr:hypothetical protein [Trichormus sp. M33_DOE_039]
MTLTSFQLRLLDSRKRQDFFYLFFLGLFPIIFSYLIGVSRTIKIPGFEGEFRGYWDSWNWMIYPLILPFSLWCLRRIGNRLFGLPTIYSFNYYKEVPILHFYQKKKGFKTLLNIQKELINIALDKKTFFLVLYLDILFHIFDNSSEIRQYVEYYKHPDDYVLKPKSVNLDWAVFFLIKNIIKSQSLQLPRDYILVSPHMNLLFSLSAYLNQFIIIFMTWSAIILIFKYNVFYLTHIYIRSHTPQRESNKYIILDFEDPNSAFGLSDLYKSFRLQILILVLAGIALLFSRYANVSPENYSLGWVSRETINSSQPFVTFLRALAKISIKKLFPDTGQCVIGIAWLIGFLGVSLPSLVKFLPLGFLRNPLKLIENIVWGIKPVEYFREFITPEDEKNRYPLNSHEDIVKVYKKFKCQSFWPIGDKNALRLFVLVCFVFYVLIIPLKLQVVGVEDLINIIFLITMAGGTSALLLYLLNEILASYLPPPE